MPVADGFPVLVERLDCTPVELDVTGRWAFVLKPDAPAPGQEGEPWVWYAPSFRGTNPKANLAWYFERFLAAGLAVAGVDVGESYGSPPGRAIYAELHRRLTEEFSFSPRSCLMPQSRGGLMLYNWAAEHPEQVACIAGIFPVGDLRSYPGLEKACRAYGLEAGELEQRLAEHNPIERLAPLAAAGVPILHVHGDSDKVVPLERNSGELVRRYRKLGGRAELIVVPGKGHEVVPEFFQRQELVDFILRHARG